MTLLNLPTVDPPTFLQIEPVGQCNLRCQMCPIQFRRDGPPYGPPAFMAFEAFTRILDQLPGLRELQLQGLASISTEGFFASNAGESSKKHAVFCHLR
jgi:hypothetical protein